MTRYGPISGGGDLRQPAEAATAIATPLPAGTATPGETPGKTLVDIHCHVAGIGAVVGGHSHSKVEKPIPVNGAYIVQAWEHGKALGVLDLTVEDGRLAGFNGWLVDIKPGIGDPDRVVQALVDKYRRRVDAALDGYVGKTEVDLDGENVCKRETNLGDLIADIVRSSAGADAARAAEAAQILALAERLGLQLDLWEAQNRFWAWAGVGPVTLERESAEALARRLWFDPAALLARAGYAPAA